MFTETFFTRATSENNPNVHEPKHLYSIDEWVNIIWYAHTMEYYSATNRGKVLTAGTYYDAVQ